MNTRESWLIASLDKLQPLFAHYKLKLAPKIAITCGWPSKGGLKETNPCIGETWPGDVTFDDTRHVFISPRLADPVKVLETVVHELIHTAMEPEEKHGTKFKNACKEIGLEGKATATFAGGDLTVRLQAIAEELGEYPNQAINPFAAKPKEPGKKATFKCFCANKREANNKCRITDKNIGKDYTVSVGKKMLECGFPMCPCGFPLEMEPEDFEQWQQWKTDAGEGGVSDKDL